MENTSGFTGDIGDIHRDIFILFDIADGDPGSEKRLFKRETTTQKKADKIRLPKSFDVFDSVMEFPFFVNIVTRNIRSNIRIRR